MLGRKLGRRDRKFWPFALLGLAGKVLGPIGAIIFCAMGSIPPQGLLVNVFNDLVWWPAFVVLILRGYRAE